MYLQPIMVLVIFWHPAKFDITRPRNNSKSYGFQVNKGQIEHSKAKVKKRYRKKRAIFMLYFIRKFVIMFQFKSASTFT